MRLTSSTVFGQSCWAEGSGPSYQVRLEALPAFLEERAEAGFVIVQSSGYNPSSNRLRASSRMVCQLFFQFVQLRKNGCDPDMGLRGNAGEQVHQRVGEGANQAGVVDQLAQEGQGARPLKWTNGTLAVNRPTRVTLPGEKRSCALLSIPSISGAGRVPAGARDSRESLRACVAVCEPRACVEAAEAGRIIPTRAS